MSLGNFTSELQWWIKTNWIIFQGFQSESIMFSPYFHFSDRLWQSVLIFESFFFKTTRQNKLDKIDFCYKYGSFKTCSLPSHLAAVYGQHSHFPVEMPNSEETSSSLLVFKREWDVSQSCAVFVVWPLLCV